jgi:LmbE family N-acetylglucosaminyl deacetylase
MAIELPNHFDWRPPELPDDERTPPRGRALCFAPHPDDEVIGAGGSLFLHRQQGDAVRVVIATDGRAGDPDGHHDPATYPELRRGESRRACAVLEIDDLSFWGFPDNHVVTEVDLAAVAQRTRAEVDAFAPDIVYLPWERESHGDHVALHWGVRRGLVEAGYAGAVRGYEVWSAIDLPDVVVALGAAAERKREALRCHRSQFEYIDYEHPVFGMMAYRSMVRHGAVGFSEAFKRYA